MPPSTHTHAHSNKSVSHPYFFTRSMYMFASLLWKHLNYLVQLFPFDYTFYAFHQIFTSIMFSAPYYPVFRQLKVLYKSTHLHPTGESSYRGPACQKSKLYCLFTRIPGFLQASEKARCHILATSPLKHPTLWQSFCAKWWDWKTGFERTLRRMSWGR